MINERLINMLRPAFFTILPVAVLLGYFYLKLLRMDLEAQELRIQTIEMRQDWQDQRITEAAEATAEINKKMDEILDHVSR